LSFVLSSSANVMLFQSSIITSTHYIMKIMYPLHRLIATLSCVVIVSHADAQSTYTWANSNITATPTTPLDWFAGGPNTQGTWTGGDPVSSNLNTIELFLNTPALTYTGNPSTQVANLNNGGSSFQLGTLTLNGAASTTANAKLTMTLSGDALHFSGAAGTINLNATRIDTNRHMTYNLNHDIQLGTVSSSSVLTITGNGTLGNSSNNTGGFIIGGAITELQSGGSTIIKNGSSHVTLANASNIFSGPIEISGGRLTFATTGAWGGTGKNVTFAGNAQVSSTADGYTGGTLTVNPGVTATLGGGDTGITTGSLTFATTTGSGSVSYAANNNKTLNLGNASGLTGNLTARLRGNANFVANTTIQFTALSDAVGSKLQFVGGTSDSNQAMTILFTGGSAPLVFDNRQIETLPRLASNWSPRDSIIANNNSNTANTWTINTDLSWGYTNSTAGAARNFILSGSNTGENAFNGMISGTTAVPLNLSKNGAGKWIVGHTDNAYTGITNITAGTLEVKKLADGGETSSIGSSSNAAANLLLGNGTTFRYTGTGDSSDRLFTINGTAAGHQATINSSGAGAINLTNAGSIAYGTTNQTRTLNLRGTNTGLNTLTASLEDNGSGALSVIKHDAGTWVLNGDSTYTGNTTVNAGTLHVNGSLSIGGLITVNPGAEFGGSGTVGHVSLLGDAALAPGNSAGSLEVTSLSLNSSSMLKFELGTPNLGEFPVGSDFVSVLTSLTLAGDIYVSALPGFNSAQIGDSWVLFNYQTGNLTDLGVTIASTPLGYEFIVDTQSVDGQVLLVATAVPEPSSLLLLLAGTAFLIHSRRLLPR